MIDPLVSLVHAVYSNKGVYAVLLGSGISRAAGIATGWEITLALVRRVATAEGVKEELPDPADWFRKTKGREPDYSGLLDALAATPEERRAILHSFIVPSPQDIEARIKVPTAAHRAVARLASRGYIRVILTTNFDRLIETALRDAGIEPTVISSADDAAGAMPLTHSGCVVVKLHGDYLDTRIRNTPAELAAYDPPLDRYLDRVFDEFGLIVVGWSGEWDDALRAAIARCPTRRFTTWWAARGGRLQDRARDLADARRAQVIAIEDADAFLTDLEQKVLALEELDRPHPLSAKLAVAELKRYLSDPQQQIRLHDLVFGEVRSALARISNVTMQGDLGEFQRRVEAYEAASEILRPVTTIGARWCREEDEIMWCEVVRRTCHSYHATAGRTEWIELQAYLPLVAFYAVGLGATAGDRFNLLRRLFETRVRLGRGKELTAVQALLPFTAFSDIDSSCWNTLTAPTASATPVSDRLLHTFERDVPDLVGSTADFEELLDRFEVLAALSYVHQREPPEFDLTTTWFFPGRFIWRRRSGKMLVQTWLDQADIERDTWPPIAAGLFGGSFARFSQLRTALLNFAGRARGIA